MNDNLSSMITPKNLVKDNLSRVMPLRSKGVLCDINYKDDYISRFSGNNVLRMPAMIVQRYTSDCDK